MNPNSKDSPALPIRRDLTLAYAVSLVIAAMMAIASVVGLLNQTTIYPTDELLQAFVPNDVVNLLIGLPILLISMWLTRRGKLIGLLLWPGALFYIFYSYLVYLFSVPFNVGYLMHLTLVTLCAYTMIGLVANIEGKSVQQRLAGAVPERGGGGVLAGLGLLILVRIIAVFVTVLLNDTSSSPSEFALNVSDFMITPVWVIGGVMLWRRAALGYVTGLGLLFQASMAFVGLIAIMVIQPLLTDAPFSLVDVAVVSIMGLVCFIPFGLFARGAAR